MCSLAVFKVSPDPVVYALNALPFPPIRYPDVSLTLRRCPRGGAFGEEGGVRVINGCPSPCANKININTVFVSSALPRLSLLSCSSVTNTNV